MPSKSVAQWISGFTSDLLLMSSNPTGAFKIFTFLKIF